MNKLVPVTRLTLQSYNITAAEERRKAKVEELVVDLYERVIHQAKTSTNTVLVFKCSTLGYDADFIKENIEYILNDLSLVLRQVLLSYRDETIAISWS